MTKINQSIITSALELAKNQLYSFANSSDFQTKMQLAFGVAVDSNSFQIAWKNQDFSVIPNIEVRTGSELGGAIGAYAQATNTIYLSQDYLNQNAADIESITSVLLEEIGHAVDAKINIFDTPGEEGAIFSGVVQGKTFEPEQIQQLKAEDDTAIIFLDGQLIQIEQAQPISKSGGVGGLTLPFQLDPLPQGQTEKSITVNYSYEHFSIPDQFEIRYGATPIFSTGGLVSNGKSGSKSFKQVSGNDQLTIKVTAPQSGTAWQFSVSTDAAEINVDGKVGDVIKIDLGKQKGNLALKSLPDASKGKLIDEKGENATTGTTYKVLYYVPKVTGAIQTYGKDRTGDLGLGQVTFDVEDQDQKSLTVKVSVTDGFSTTGSNTVKVEKGKLNVYTQQQRLAYLGFPGSSGSPLVVDGDPDTDFKDLVVNIKSTNDPLPLGTNLQGKQQGEVLDLRGITNNVKADFTVNREAAFNNFVGFYKVADENGGIDIDGDGTVDFRPGDSGYAQAAIKNRVAGIDLGVDNQGTASFTDKTLTGGSIFAPFILTDGRTVDQVLNGQVNQAYFAYLGANSDKVSR
ncbi:MULTISPECIES: hypothetical protein [unclassified Anabaena]|uniref:hypothetical protein n=1 Tax=unclassified Anabaena TaxID=2619674 RepID=UPI0006AC4FB6|nr:MULTISPECIES: hypothetical protein [unclassified Anabaena]ALB39647.1 hypothetical protein AA650_03460 [Anabaena sp. WA102]OBQ15860.1 MAG: hypothetical protein AN486_21425 [Anabaena sp. AL93]